MPPPRPKSEPSTAYIALGSNLHDPFAQIQRGIVALAGLKESQLEKTSSFYLNPAWGFDSASKKAVPLPSAPDYINAVLKLSTALSPEALLSELQAIETKQQRQRQQQWGPRTLDLDLLFFDDLSMQSPHLTLPHPRLRERLFVLYPLAEIAPDLLLTKEQTVSAYIASNFLIE